MKIAVLYVCTGNYSVFWTSFYKESKQFFYPKEERHFFVFTDDEELIKQSKELKDVDVYFQRRSGWPYDTLLRFNSFCMIQDRLREYDCCYFWNANAHFLKVVDETVIPFADQEKQLILWRHTGKYQDEYGETFEAERNPISKAYVAPGERCCAYGGGFFGGASDAFVKMSCELRDWIAIDLQSGYIAKWHDQSHLQKYGTANKCIEVPEYTIMSEEYMSDKDPYVIFWNKDHFGGNGKLRNLPFHERVKLSFRKFVKYVYLNTFIGTIVRKIRKKHK